MTQVLNFSIRFLGIILFFTTFGFSYAEVINCALDHPDEDVKRIFPQSTSYKVRDLIPSRHGDKNLKKKIEPELLDLLGSKYENFDTPQTYYLVYSAQKLIGLIHGVNTFAQKGVIQVFLAYEKNGQVKDMYVQRLTSPDLHMFRSKYYREQFKKFGITKVLDEPYASPPVRNPSNETIQDHHSLLRAVRVNLLFTKYFYNRFSE